MVKSIFAACTFLTSLLLFVTIGSTAPTKPVLTLLNWSEYMDPELIAEFEAQHNVEVREVYFETEDLRTDMLLRAKQGDFDLVVCNDLSIRAYVNQGWIEPLSQAEVPNLKYMDPRWQKLSPESVQHGAPFLWGTTGIAYRTDKIAEPVKSWQALFSPEEKLRNKILMVNDVGDMIGMSLKTLGYSANSTDLNAHQEIEELLLKQKPYVRNYGYMSLDENSVLVTGEIWMAMMYNGDAMMIRELNTDIEYVVPEEGGNLWVDYLCVMSSSKQKALAKAFINFLNEPNNAARLAQFAYYATPNLAAEKLLPEDFLSNPYIYPPAKVLAKSEIYQPLPGEILRIRNRILNRVIQR